MKKVLYSLFFSASSLVVYSQSVGINTDGSSADASSILDVKSSTKGVLVPRMTLVQRNDISLPANGLLIYQTDNTPGFYFYDGSSWIRTATAENAIYTAGTGISISSNVVSLDNTTVSSGNYGSSTQVGTFTVDAQGRLTEASNTTISGVSPGGSAGGDLTGTYPNPSIATGAVSLTTNVSGTLPVANGGTGSTTLSGLVLGNGTSAMSTVTTSSGLAGALSDETGSGAAVFANSPTFSGTPSLPIGTTGVSQTPSTSNTNLATTAFVHAVNAINANLTGDVTSSGNATTYNNVVPANKGGAGTVNGIMKANGSGLVSAATAGTDYENALTFSLPLSRSTNTISLGTVGVANGGTGQTSFTDGQLLIGNTTGNTLTKSTLTAGTGISITNGGGSITITATASVPSGVIVMWSGTLATIPTGWALCDGTNGTPNLRDRFILSVNTSENPGSTGGAHSYTLSSGQLPAHSHTGTTNNTTPSLTFTGTSGTTSSNGAGTVSNMLWDDGGSYAATGTLSLTAGTRTRSWSGTSGNAMRTLNIANHTHTFTPAGTISGGSHNHSFTTATTGAGETIDNRPAFYKLAFIMKL